MKNGINAPGARALLGALVFALVAVIPASGRTAFSGIVVFGDSLNDNGNLYALTGGAYPPPQYYWNGRYSNGPVWPEYVAARLGMTDRLFDHAIAGSTTADILDQIALYAADLGGSPADPEVLFMLDGGANDFLGMPPDGDPVETLVDAVTNLGTAVGWLQALGAKHIVVVNLPNLGLVPRGRAMPDGGAGLTWLSAYFNAQLENVLEGLEDGFDGRIIRGDAFGFVTTRVTDPARFGLVNVTVPVLFGGSPDRALFWDDIHPTTMGHSQFAEEILSAILVAYSPRQGVGSGQGTINGLRGFVTAK